MNIFHLIELVQTLYGEVPVKIGMWHNEDITRSPEIDDCIRLANDANVPVRMVYDAASLSGRKKYDRNMQIERM